MLAMCHGVRGTILRLHRGHLGLYADYTSVMLGSYWGCSYRVIQGLYTGIYGFYRGFIDRNAKALAECTTKLS